MSTMSSLAEMRDTCVDALSSANTAKLEWCLGTCVGIMERVLDALGEKKRFSISEPAVASTTLLVQYISCILPPENVNGHRNRSVLNRFTDCVCMTSELSVFHHSVCKAIRESTIIPIALKHHSLVDLRASHVIESMQRTIPIMMHAYLETKEGRVEAMFFTDYLCSVPAVEVTKWVMEMFMARHCSIVLRNLLGALMDIMEDARTGVCIYAIQALNNIICHPDVLGIACDIDFIPRLLMFATASMSDNCRRASASFLLFSRCVQVGADGRETHIGLLRHVVEEFLRHVPRMMNGLRNEAMFHPRVTKAFLGSIMYVAGVCGLKNTRGVLSNKDVSTARTILECVVECYKMMVLPSEEMDCTAYFVLEEVMQMPKENIPEIAILARTIDDMLDVMHKTAVSQETPRISHVFMMMKFVEDDMLPSRLRNMFLEEKRFKDIVKHCMLYSDMHVSILACAVMYDLTKDITYFKSLLVGILVRAEHVFSEEVITDQKESGTFAHLRTPNKFRVGLPPLAFVHAMLKAVSIATVEMILRCVPLWTFVRHILQETKTDDVSRAQCVLLLRDLMDYMECVPKLEGNKKVSTAFFDTLRIVLPDSGPSTSPKLLKLAARKVVMAEAMQAEMLMELHRIEMFDAFLLPVISTNTTATV